MRNALNSALMSKCKDTDFCFLTGDLGFMAFEKLQQAMGESFINMGLAEQNMVSVAAGLARSKLRPWVYSIAPFCYARPFEQTRNDICLHNLPVTLVGNGGGYAYGVQGPSHHAIEDCGVMSALQNMRVFAPAFLSDVSAIVDLLAKSDHPSYVRLGRDEAPTEKHVPAYLPIRQLVQGTAGVVIALGAIAGTTWQAILKMPESKRPSLWCCCELPIASSSLPEEFLKQAATLPYLAVVEEHVKTGGLGASLASLLIEKSAFPQKFIHKYAKGYPSGLYGSQQFHRRECGMDLDSLVNLFNNPENAHE